MWHGCRQGRLEGCGKPGEKFDLFYMHISAEPLQKFCFIRMRESEKRKLEASSSPCLRVLFFPKQPEGLLQPSSRLLWPPSALRVQTPGSGSEVGLRELQRAAAFKESAVTQAAWAKLPGNSQKRLASGWISPAALVFWNRRREARGEGWGGVFESSLDVRISPSSLYLSFSPFLFFSFFFFIILF